MGNAKLTATPKQVGNTIEWTLEHRNKSGGPGKFPPVEVTGSMSPCKFDITIDNRYDLDITFADDPIWIVEGDTCPQGPGIFTSQVDPDSIKLKDGNTRLIFVDKNTDPPVDLMYRLNFVDTYKNPVEPLDPEIKNTGGGGFVRNSAALVIGLAFLTVGLVAIAAYAWSRR